MVVKCGSDPTQTRCWRSVTMAFGKDGWRKIVLEERVYFWQTQEWSPDLFQVRPERDPHRLLCVRGSQCGLRGGFLRDAMPGIVRVGIECAIKNGWLEKHSRLRLVAFSDPLHYVFFQPGWLTSTVLALATGIYDDRAFDRMPILADALQDAGCDNADILDHCRGSGPHVRGCWVVDMLLGKS